MNSMNPQAIIFEQVVAGPATANLPELVVEQNRATAEDVIYDALDYRLMATFPASDATAQY